jgi:hypothetical protein
MQVNEKVKSGYTNNSKMEPALQEGFSDISRTKLPLIMRLSGRIS